jgi:hypothetical protein
MQRSREDPKNAIFVSVGTMLPLFKSLMHVINCNLLFFKKKIKLVLL